MEFEITKMGERGQVVIPQEFRKEMHIHKGEKFIVLQRKDMIILKRFSAPTKEEFDRMLKEGHEHAKKHKLTKKDMWSSIKKARAK